VKALKMAVVFGECGRECLSGPGNTEVFSVLAGRGGGGVSANIISEPLIFAIQRTGAWLNCN
jgi:hypothetical protein